LNEHWLNRSRRLARDFEPTIASATAWLVIASIQPSPGA
jgi:putative transposase